jgi:plasmid stability protein
VAQLIVRKLDPAVKERLKRRALRRGRSMEEEARAILRDAVRDEPVPRRRGPGLGTRIARRFEGIGFDFEIPEWRGYPARPAKFEK